MLLIWLSLLMQVIKSGIAPFLTFCNTTETNIECPLDACTGLKKDESDLWMRAREWIKDMENGVSAFSYHSHIYVSRAGSLVNLSMERQYWRVTCCLGDAFWTYFYPLYDNDDAWWHQRTIAWISDLNNLMTEYKNAVVQSLYASIEISCYM